MIAHNRIDVYKFITNSTTSTFVHQLSLLSVAGHWSTQTFLRTLTQSRHHPLLRLYPPQSLYDRSLSGPETDPKVGVRTRVPGITPVRKGKRTGYNVKGSDGTGWYWGRSRTFLGLCDCPSLCWRTCSSPYVVTFFCVRDL